MDLLAYHKKIQSYKLNDAEKNDLYARILRSTQEAPVLSRTGFYSKFIGYSVVLGLLGLSIYIPYLSTHQNNDTPTQIAGRVKADYIAKVVNIQGDYEIESAGSRIKSTDIADGDTIVLSVDSSLIVTMGDHLQGTITGPAKFTVHKKDAGYALTLLEGDFMEIATLGDATAAPEISIVSVQHKFTAHSNAGMAAHVVITEKDNKAIVLNKGSEEITITDEKKDNLTPIALAKNTTIDVGNMVVLTHSVPTIEVATLIAKKNNDPSIKTESAFDNGFFRSAILAQPDAIIQDTPTMAPSAPIVASADQITTALHSMSADTTTEQPIIAPIKRSELRTSLLPQFVWVDIKYVTYYYLEGNDTAYDYAYNNLRTRLLEICTAISLTIPNDINAEIFNGKSNLAGLHHLVTYILQNIPTSIPTHQVKTMQTLNDVITTLLTQPYGAFSGQGLDVNEMFAKIQP